MSDVIVLVDAAVVELAELVSVGGVGGVNLIGREEDHLGVVGLVDEAKQPIVELVWSGQLLLSDFHQSQSLKLIHSFIGRSCKIYRKQRHVPNICVLFTQEELILEVGGDEVLSKLIKHLRSVGSDRIDAESLEVHAPDPKLKDGVAWVAIILSSQA